VLFHVPGTHPAGASPRRRCADVVVHGRRRLDVPCVQNGYLLCPLVSCVVVSCMVECRVTFRLVLHVRALYTQQRCFRGNVD
jgi:hypothetical protein